MLAEKTGFRLPAAGNSELQHLADRFTEQALATLEKAKENGHTVVTTK